MKLSSSAPNLRDGHVPPAAATKRLLQLGDMLIALVVVGPLVVLHWRGTWALMDRFPMHFAAAKSAALAALLLCTIAMMREFLFEQCSRRPPPQRLNGVESGKVKGAGEMAELSRGERLSRHVLKKVFVLVFSLGCNMHWRSAWALLDEYFGVSCEVAAFEIGLCLVGLVMLRSVRNLVAPPTVILPDNKEMYFRFPTRYRIKASDEPGLYILDCLFSVLVIGSLVVFVWRGVWILCDLLIYPEDFKYSSWVSLLFGYAIVGASFCLQSTMRWLCEQLTGLPRLAAADIFLAFSFIGTVNVWRGVWNLCDLYFIPDHKLAGDIITHSVSFLLLALLNCSNSVLVRGVYIDAEEPAGQCVIFPVYYVRMFFQKERTKKLKRKQQPETGGATTLLPLLADGGDADTIKKPTIVIVPASVATPPPTTVRSTHGDVINHVSETNGSGNNNDE